jgi:hypothetical protein
LAGQTSSHRLHESFPPLLSLKDGFPILLGIFWFFAASFPSKFPKIEAAHWIHLLFWQVYFLLVCMPKLLESVSRSIDGEYCGDF